MIQLYLTDEEKSVVEDIKEIGYGELYAVSVGSSSTAPNRLQLQDRFHDFIKELRRLGSFETVIIHDSQPQYATYNAVTEHGRDCLKRIKF